MGEGASDVNGDICRIGCTESKEQQDCWLPAMLTSRVKSPRVTSLLEANGG